MFSFALLIGIYSYLILSLGLLGLLYKSYIIVLTVFYFSIVIYFNRNLLIKTFFQYCQVLEKCLKLDFVIKKVLHNPVLVLLISLLVLQATINFIGSLGPELGFDALWYHLTLPKLYLNNHTVLYIPGSLLYYSLMPKLMEMIYTAGFVFGSEVFAKLIHFSFGIFSLIALYSLARTLFDKNLSFLVLVIFYSNLVVAWESTTAYVDLARTLFEIMALWGFVNWWKRGERRWLIESAVMLGLAISTKLLALGSMIIFSVLIIFFYVTRHSGKQSASRISQSGWRFWTSQNDGNDSILRNLFIYLFIALLIPLPWFIFSFIHTGNPIYPFFTNIYKTNIDLSLMNPLKFINDTFNVFTHAADPISPVFIMFLPLVLIFFKRFTPILKIVAIYSFLAIIVWYITPRTGGGRFLLPYLPAFSILVAAAIEEIKDKSLKMIFIGVIIIVSSISILYRGFANAKYIPVILGKETKAEFLANHLNFSFGDFYDTDNYFKTHINSTDTVLLYGFHNLYYIDFPFIDSSYVVKGDRFNYIAVQNGNLPKRFSYWNIIYYNSKTHTKLYSLGGQKWVY